MLRPFKTARALRLMRLKKKRRAERQRVVLFDFDGTLADTLLPSLRIFNQLSAEFGFRPIPEDELPLARELSARQILLHCGIPKRKVPRIAARGIALLRQELPAITPFSGIAAALQSLRSAGCTLGIVSSNSESNVRLFLSRHGLELFDVIRCSSRLFGKAHDLRRLLKTHRWLPERTLFIGDECRDIEAAHQAGIRALAVTWGYNTAHALAAMQPSGLVESPETLPDAVLALLPTR